MTLSVESVNAALEAASLHQLWSVQEVTSTAWTIDFPESVDTDHLRDALFQVRDMVFTLEGEDGIEVPIWPAARRLLSAEKYSAIETIFADENASDLSEDTVAMAMLSETKPQEAAITFSAIGPIAEYYAGEIEKVSESLRAEDAVNDKLLEWKLACRLGWIDALPLEFTLSRMNSFEDDTMLLHRCCATLHQLTKILQSPAAEADLESLHNAALAAV